MKNKSLYILALAAALVGCTKETVSEVKIADSGDFVVYASAADTKTTNDGMTTNWSIGDRISLFHAPTGTAEYVADGRWDCETPSVGLFTSSNGTVPELDAAKSYDWYAYFRYNSNAKSPEATNSVLIGPHPSNGMTQNGNNSMAHLCGNSFPLVGRALNVPGTDVPRIQMKHVHSLLAFRITNITSTYMVVKEIHFTAPYDVLGYSKINLTGDEPVLDLTRSSKTGKLIVNEGEKIASGESAMFYLAIAPMTAKAGDMLSVETVAEVGSTASTQIFEKTLMEETRFASGGMKTMDIKFSQQP